ncbi:MAG: serine protease, partial [Acetatifactor sp.]|nr:serine protease [Acetatifactor sp.]
EPYYDYQAVEDIFTTSEGEAKTVPFLRNEEHVFIEDEYATGFLKTYKGGKYAFVAMLPNEKITVDEYVKTLDGVHLGEMLSGARDCVVYTSLPKFETEYSVEMSAVLKTMGMPLAFDATGADFGKLGKSQMGNIFINRVLHKTYIAVDEKGTKAGAATAVEMTTESAMEITDYREVYLTRPFVYMLIDCETNLPLFIGVLRDPTSESDGLAE